MPSTSAPLLRPARPSDAHALALLLTRAFFEDRFLRWLGSVKRPGFVCPPPTATPQDIQKLPHDTRQLYDFYDSIARSVALAGGRVMLVVEGEKILAAALWLPPGGQVESLRMIWKSKSYRLVLGWGLGAFHRAVIVAKPTFTRLHEAACKKQGTTLARSWILQTIATDPLAEGKGCMGMLMRDGLTAAGNAPVVLEACEPKPQAIYLHYGFEITGKPVLGKGDVDFEGYPKRRGEGLELWMMIYGAPQKEPKAKATSAPKAGAESS
ncbi:hypothetical protein AURDEDRAFT_166485 [Auricularia subglabra TFB-10046 SS5]|nr:hypothetical protein AURDEDRAFT_166485 [Auricularia subglabra TFB-10046 SS5]